MDLGLPLGSTKRCLKLHIESCSVRIAVSHLVLHRLLKAHAPVIMQALQQPGSTSNEPRNTTPARVAGGEAVEANPFRQSYNRIDVDIENEVSAWLCNDGSHSFGAPDVLQVPPTAATHLRHAAPPRCPIAAHTSHPFGLHMQLASPPQPPGSLTAWQCMQGALSCMQLQAEVDVLRPDAPPTVRARVDLRTSMRFLDIASGDWEWLLCPWQVGGEYLYVAATDPHSNGTAKTAPAQIMSVQSRQHAVTHFTAASLLTAGDAFAYGNALMKEEQDNGGAGGSGGSKPAGSVYAAVLGVDAPPTRPSMDEQMALSLPLTERMPQRYCIQNHLGASMWYWRPAPGPHASLSKYKLTPGQSHQMLCEPHSERVIFAQNDGLQVPKPTPHCPSLTDWRASPQCPRVHSTPLQRCEVLSHICMSGSFTVRYALWVVSSTAMTEVGVLHESGRTCALRMRRCRGRDGACRPGACTP